MISKIARHGSPVDHQAWRELVDDFDNRLDFVAESDEDEAVVDLWLENPMSFMGTTVDPDGITPRPSGVRRLQSGGMGLRRAADPRPKTASVSDWDSDFAEAKAHAAAVLKNIGNA